MTTTTNTRGCGKLAFLVERSKPDFISNIIAMLTLRYCILVKQSLNKKGSGKQVCRNLEANVSARARGKRE